jgi:hypothetical protein
MSMAAGFRGQMSIVAREEKVMLSEHDHQILREIEACIARESPKVARTLDRPVRLHRPYDLLIGIGVATAILCWALAEHGTFGSGVLAAGLAVVVAAARHRRYRYRLPRLHLRDDWFEPF